ncbi:unnamed protein product [Lymnaea stagnalis]|uniref:Uncharacterized protein n=1 Tax=Lymnaea stagnalis TaxID=6523 RepID=A0AAV2HXT3_LYMST
MTTNISNMQRLVANLNRQLETLKEERDHLVEVVDDYVNQVQAGVGEWVGGEPESQAGFVETAVSIQQAIAFVFSKSQEFTERIKKENSEVMAEASNDQSSIKSTTSVRSDPQHEQIILNSGNMEQETGFKAPGVIKDVQPFYSLMVKLSILEETVYSFQKMTEQVQEKQSHMEKLLKTVFDQQSQVNRKLDSVSESHVKSKNRIKDHDNNLNGVMAAIKRLDASMSNNNAKIDRFQIQMKENAKSMQDMKSQIRSHRAALDKDLMAINDLSLNTEQEIFVKIKKLEASINLMPFKCKRKHCTAQQNDPMDTIGMICQMLVKRVDHLEELREILNKSSTTRNSRIEKVDALEAKVVELSKTISTFSSW